MLQLFQNEQHLTLSKNSAFKSSTLCCKSKNQEIPTVMPILLTMERLQKLWPRPPRGLGVACPTIATLALGGENILPRFRV